MPCRRQTALALRSVQSRLETKSVVKADLSEPCDDHPRKQAKQEGRRKRSVKAVVARAADQPLGTKHLEADDCRQLWAAMLLQSVRDAFTPRQTRFGNRETMQAQALDWLLSEDCATVVALAGYGDGVADRLADMVARHRAGEAVLDADERLGPSVRRSKWDAA
jgi:hypothetical protein